MHYQDLYFEDFTVGGEYRTGARTIGEAEIIAFGESYAPLPYHTDAEAAKDSMFGGLVAPGLQTAAISFGLFIGCGIFDCCALGSTGCAGAARCAPTIVCGSWRACWSVHLPAKESLVTS